MVLKKYNEIVDQVLKIERILSEKYDLAQGEINQQEIDDLMINMFSAADKLMADYDQEGKGKSPEELAVILKKLDNIKAEVLLTANLYKDILKQKDIKFKDIKTVKFSEISVGDFTCQGRAVEAAQAMLAQEKKNALPAFSMQGVFNQHLEGYSEEEKEAAKAIIDMLSIYGDNYAHKPDLQKLLLDSYWELLKEGGDKTKLYIYKDHGKVVAFDRFDQEEGKKRFFGSFNVDSSIRGLSIGNDLMTFSLGQESKDENGQNITLEATTDPDTDICTRYIGQEKFVVTEVMPEYGGTKWTIFKINRNESANQSYRYLSSNKQQVLADFEKKLEDDNFKIFKFPDNSPEMYDKTAELINNQDFVMTRYVKDKGEAYCVFERLLN
jgi:hypothetical protein